MRAPRAAGILVGGGLWFAGAGIALAAGPETEVMPPDLPAPVVVEPLGRATVGQEPPRQDISTEVAPPELPTPTVVVEPLPGPGERPAIATVAPEPAPAPQPQAPDVAVPDLPPAPVMLTVADRLGPALAGLLAEGERVLHPRLPRKEREALAAFYALGNYEPLFVAGEGWSPAGRAVLARLAAAAEDGLETRDYPVPPLAVRPGEAPEDAAARLAEAELRLAAAAVVYARDARGGRLEPARLSALITPKLELPSAEAVLTALAEAADAGAALAAFHPPHEGYRALRAKLAEIRAGAPAASPRLEADIVANMERWRWLPPELGARHIAVNIPEYRLRIIADGEVIHESRVIVGKPATPTPVFSDLMDHVIVNPSWHIPPSILKNEILPGLAKDPTYAARRGYEVVRRGNSISVRQPPGARNALGFIKFMFPNQHAVYLHDTPNRSLFGSERRAFSHGCVRVDQPFRLGEILLGRDEGFTEARLRGMVGYGERMIRLARKVPVHLTYFTVMVDASGDLRQADDLYGFSGRVRKELGLEGGASAKVAERSSPARVAPDAPPVADVAAIAAPPVGSDPTAAPAPKRAKPKPARAKPASPKPAVATAAAPAPIAAPRGDAALSIVDRNNN